MYNLRNCPKCGGRAKFERIQVYSADSDYDVITCIACGCRIELKYINGEVDYQSGFAEWNNQPLIDRLNDKIRVLEGRSNYANNAAAIPAG